MELLVRLLLSTTALIASAASYQSKPSYVIPNLSKREFFYNGSLNGNKVYFEEHCRCGIDKTSDYFIVDCSSSAEIPGCPRDTILAEYSPASGYHELRKTSRGNTKSVTTTTTKSIDTVTESPIPIYEVCLENALNWFLIAGIQFVVIIVLLVQKLCQRRRSALGQHTSSSTPQGSYVDPTPLPSEAGYEVVPIVPHAVMRKVHEGHKLDKNDTPTTQHYTYDSILNETEDTNKIYYSTIKI